jgi:hypothetical protein
MQTTFEKPYNGVDFYQGWQCCLVQVKDSQSILFIIGSVYTEDL